jgi:ferrous iron transport protein B
LSKNLGVPVVGTIARNKKTLRNLLDTIYKVCIKKIRPSPKCVTYSSKIEATILEISNILHDLYELPEHLYRWVALKFLDGNLSILSSIQEHLHIDLNHSKLLEIKNCYLDKSNSIRDEIVSQIVKSAEAVASEVCTFTKSSHSFKDRKIDKVLTSKKFGIPIMLLFLALIFWITIVGANYPSQMLFSFFSVIQEKLLIKASTFGVPKWISDMLILGIYQTVTWIVSVMLPPMAIFFPLFTILEDMGYLPRIAFNLDKYFKKACTSGKQMITMCMGFGCNACGVTGCRIIDSPRERLVAILTNSFVPCNGRYPFLITVASIFIVNGLSGLGSSIISTLSVILVILLGIILSLIVSKLLSKTILKGVPSSFVLELPPYRKPQFRKNFTALPF